MDSLNTEKISQTIHECPSDRWSYEKEQLSSFDANQLKIYSSVKKTINDFDYGFQPKINRTEIIVLYKAKMPS